MSENLDIKDLGLLTSASDSDRILMTQASAGHAAKAMTVAVLKKSMGFMRATNANSYYGLTTPDNNASTWIRTTVNGIIPYQSGGASALGTTSWPFGNAHINTVSCKQLISTIATGTAPFTVASTTNVKNLNADLLDGLHASSLARGQYISGSTGTNAGWYRIATSTVSIGNCGGLFTIEATVSGAHSVTTIFAGCTYGVPDGTTLNILGHTYYGSHGITQVRIVYHSTYNGNYAHLEVYVPTASSRVISVNATGIRGWSLTSPSTVGNIPSGYSNKIVTLYARSISADILRPSTLNINNRLITNSSGQIYPNSTSYRSAGMYGIYDSSKIGHIWSIGTTYKIPDDGTTFGTLYGMAYKYTNNTTGGTMANGHQIVFCNSGVP